MYYMRLGKYLVPHNTHTYIHMRKSPTCVLYIQTYIHRHVIWWARTNPVLVLVGGHMVGSVTMKLWVIPYSACILVDALSWSGITAIRHDKHRRNILANILSCFRRLCCSTSTRFKPPSSWPKPVNYITHFRRVDHPIDSNHYHTVHND